ncbi:hypothetical protein SAMN05216223_110232 [Actinacidiphila yanglinensis]|uniref:Uncharacterized protein n=1 Tax=Actinacidiphila yanglinensis TaxID=310779 RepID=A0A1H6CYJ8_9ACTN|nr:hypothetical protein SAMN05216223_110232 [Actinacidiphila yanglinensis]
MCSFGIVPDTPATRMPGTGTDGPPGEEPSAVYARQTSAYLKGLDDDCVVVQLRCHSARRQPAEGGGWLPRGRTAGARCPSSRGPSAPVHGSRGPGRSVAAPAQVAEPHGGPSPERHRFGRPPAAVAAVRRRTVRRLPGRPLGSPRTGRGAAPYDRDPRGRRTGVVAPQQVQHAGREGAHRRPSGERRPASGARRGGTDGERRVMHVARDDRESAVPPEAPGGASRATAGDVGQAGGDDHPGVGHRDTPFPVRGPQRKGARRPGATRDGSALGRSHLVYNGSSSTG